MQEVVSLNCQARNTGKVFDVPQRIMNREPLKVAIITIIKSSSACFEDSTPLSPTSYKLLPEIHLINLATP